MRLATTFVLSCTTLSRLKEGLSLLRTPEDIVFAEMRDTPGARGNGASRPRQLCTDTCGPV